MYMCLKTTLISYISYKLKKKGHLHVEFSQYILCSTPIFSYFQIIKSNKKDSRKNIWATFFFLSD